MAHRGRETKRRVEEPAQIVYSEAMRYPVGTMIRAKIHIGTLNEAFVLGMIIDSYVTTRGARYTIEWYEPNYVWSETDYDHIEVARWFNSYSWVAERIRQGMDINL